MLLERWHVLCLDGRIVEISEIWVDLMTESESMVVEVELLLSTSHVVDVLWLARASDEVRIWFSGWRICVQVVGLLILEFRVPLEIVELAGCSSHSESCWSRWCIDN